MARECDLAHGRLRALPDVFGIGELADALNVERFEASRYLRAWSLRGLVIGMGGRCGLYLNRVRVPEAQAHGQLWEQAVLMAMPSALVGEAQLFEHLAWPAQATLRCVLLVSDADEYFPLDQCVVLRRPDAWMRGLRRFGLAPDAGPARPLPRLRIGASLADLACEEAHRPSDELLARRLHEPDELALYRRLIAMHDEELASLRSHC